MSGASVESRDWVTSKKAGKLSLGKLVFVQEILFHSSEKSSKICILQNCFAVVVSFACLYKRCVL